MSDPTEKDETENTDEEVLADLDADDAAEQVVGGRHGGDPCEGGEVA